MCGWAPLILAGCVDSATVAESQPEPFTSTTDAACTVNANEDPWQALLRDAGADSAVLERADPVGGWSRYAETRFPGLLERLREPGDTACHGRAQSAALDQAFSTPQPVASMLGYAMAQLNAPMGPPSVSFESDPGLARLPPALRKAIRPILTAIEQAQAVRDEVARSAPVDVDLLAVHAGCVEPNVDPTWPSIWLDEDARAFVTGPDGPTRLFDPARLLAAAIESADLTRFAGFEEGAGVYETRAGRVVIATTSEQPDLPAAPVALYLDLGGDDWVDFPAGATTEAQGVAVHIDVAGNDVYGYPPIESPSWVDGLPPADEQGRHEEDGTIGWSLSTVGRQGSGRFGIGMLFDLGGDDIYRSLTQSQGNGTLGVGVLYDAEGDDVYELEGLGQGRGMAGIGLLLDRSGNDVYRIGYHGQGAGETRGVGLAYDGSGDDMWWSPIGDEAPLLREYSAVQGVGVGVHLLNEACSGNQTSFGGGLGILRDLEGDDNYTADTFGQGVGVQQSFGFLHDGNGEDTYDVRWHGQGSAVHNAVAGFFDDGPGSDRLNTLVPPERFHLGAARDGGVSIAVLGGGHDLVHLGEIGGGAAVSSGFAVAMSLGGDDVWVLEQDTNLGFSAPELYGLGSSQEPTVGLFVDMAGWDTYRTRRPFDDRELENGGRFGHSQSSARGMSAHGGGVDLEASGVTR